MIDFTALFQILGTVALIGVPIAVFSWLLAGSDGPGLADILAVPAGPPLPRGIQEEEPIRYRVERLSRSRGGGRPAAPAVPARVAPGGRPVAALGCAVAESGPCR